MFTAPETIPDSRKAMIAYVQQIAKDLISRLQWWDEETVKSIAVRFEALAEELDRLDPRDFGLGAQFDFVEARLQVRLLAKTTQKEWDYWAEMVNGHPQRQGPWIAQLDDLHNGTHPQLTQGRDKALIEEEIRGKLAGMAAERNRYEDEFQRASKACERTIEVLTAYAGHGSKAVTRSFTFVHNADLRSIIERDYKELALILIPGAAWKSAVVMAGSILEAILYDLLTRDAALIAKAMASPKAPTKGTTAVKDITNNTSENEWKLVNLINVAVDLNLLPQERAHTIDQILRNYRNFVHPRKEIKEAHPCTEAEATLAKGALDGVCNHLL
jgi:hypothetical protein